MIRTVTPRRRAAIRSDWAAGSASSYIVMSILLRAPVMAVSIDRYPSAGSWTRRNCPLEAPPAAIVAGDAAAVVRAVRAVWAWLVVFGGPVVGSPKSI